MLPCRAICGDEASSAERSHDGKSEGLVAPVFLVDRIGCLQVFRIDGTYGRHTKIIHLDCFAVSLEQLRGVRDAAVSPRLSDLLELEVKAKDGVNMRVCNWYLEIMLVAFSCFGMIV